MTGKKGRRNQSDFSAKASSISVRFSLSYPKGAKRRNGDGRTPEGRYLLDWRIGVTLRSDLGTVVGPLDAGGGYILVRLDQPAIRRSVDGTVDDLETIVELAHPDNVERVEGDTA